MLQYARNIGDTLLQVRPLAAAGPLDARRAKEMNSDNAHPLLGQGAHEVRMTKCAFYPSPQSPSLGDMNKLQGAQSPIGGDLTTFQGAQSPIGGDLTTFQGAQSPIGGDLTTFQGAQSPIGGARGLDHFL